MKKVLTAAAAFLLGFSAFSEVSYRFYNKIFSDTLTVHHVDKDYLKTDLDFKLNEYGKEKKDSYTDFSFLGIYNRVYAEFKTDKTDAMIKATLGFKDWTNDSDYGFRWTGYVDDWFVEYRPWNYLTLGFHDGIYMDGSYLPIYDDNLYSGNIGSEGITAVYRPAALKGALRLAATAPFTTNTNWIYADEDDYNKSSDSKVGDDIFDVGLGAIYTIDLFQVGVSIQDIFDGDERRVGAYINLPTLFGMSKKVTVGGGYAHSEYWGVYNYDNSASFDDYTEFGGVNGKNLLSGYLTYDGNVDVSAEFVWNMNEKGFRNFHHHSYESWKWGGWDLYVAGSAKFWISKTVTGEVVGKLVTDLVKQDGDEWLSNIYAAQFKLNSRLTKHSEVEASVSVDYFDRNYKVCFPCYWKYTF